MELDLTFADGRMTGRGRDDVGEFTIRGHYDVTNRECHWTKSYVGAHEVYYRGFREGKGIWGTWEITVFDHGGFHIWPRGADTPVDAATAAAAEQAPCAQGTPSDAAVSA